MNAFVLATTILALCGQTVQRESESTTQLYVKTVPSGAEVTLDGKVLGKSDSLFDVAAGVHKLALSLQGYAVDERSIEVPNGEIARVEVQLKRRSGKELSLSYVGESSEQSQSYADSGHAVFFQRPAEMKSITAVKLYGTRYGTPEPPDEDFHIYLLDENQKVLEHIPVPYRKIDRDEPRWHTIEFPAVEVPEKFMVALWFNAEQTKGVQLGKQPDVQDTHSYSGLPDKGFRKVKESYEWMIRAVVSPDEGKKPSHPKVKTYEEEKAADTESTEAQPEEDGGQSKTQASPVMRTWRDRSGAFSMEAVFVGVENSTVKLKKTDGTSVAVPLDGLAKEDQEYVASQVPPTAPTFANDGRELWRDNGRMAGKASIAGGGHAVKFTTDGDSNYVTSVSLHGLRYGEPEPPQEDFKMWICDSKFNPIATFHFPYSAYIRSDVTWKVFRIKPTRVPKDFIICFGFSPHQTKGVFVSHDGQPSETSMVGIPGVRSPRPFQHGNWLIRCKVAKPTGLTKAQSDEKSFPSR